MPPSGPDIDQAEAQWSWALLSEIEQIEELPVEHRDVIDADDERVV